MRRVAIFLLTSALAVAQQNVPAAVSGVLDQWKAAIAAGDASGIRGLYSSYPPAHVIAVDGKTELPISTETDFWQKTHASGLQNLQVTVRSADQKQGAEILNLLLSFRAHTPRGLRTRYVIEQQAWVPQLGSWRMMASTRTDLLKIRPPTS